MGWVGFECWMSGEGGGSGSGGVTGEKEELANWPIGGGAGEAGQQGLADLTGADQFRRVAGLLEQNKVLINQIHSNQESGDTDRIDQNVLLIQTLNNNITAVVDQYKALSEVFLAALEGSGPAPGNTPTAEQG